MTILIPHDQVIDEMILYHKKQYNTLYSKSAQKGLTQKEKREFHNQAYVHWDMVYFWSNVVLTKEEQDGTS